jgi:hypothetical protein
MAHRPPAPALPSITSTFEVGRHVARVTRVMEGRWSVEVDGVPVPGTHRSQADAWEAGVREADRIDRPVP